MLHGRTTLKIYKVSAVAILYGRIFDHYISTVTTRIVFRSISTPRCMNASTKRFTSQVIKCHISKRQRTSDHLDIESSKSVICSYWREGSWWNIAGVFIIVLFKSMLAYWYASTSIRSATASKLRVLNEKFNEWFWISYLIISCNISCITTRIICKCTCWTWKFPY